MAKSRNVAKTMGQIKRENIANPRGRGSRFILASSRISLAMPSFDDIFVIFNSSCLQLLVVRLLHYTFVAFFKLGNDWVKGGTKKDRLKWDKFLR